MVTTRRGFLGIVVGLLGAGPRPVVPTSYPATLLAYGPLVTFKGKSFIYDATADTIVRYWPVTGPSPKA